MDFKAYGFFPPAAQWLPERDMPDQTGRVFVVTGANTGIGREIARGLLLRGAKVYAACRSKERATEAIDTLKRETGRDAIHFLQVDLASIKATVATAEAFVASEDRLDGLINSATEDGIELQFGTNVVGHYALTMALLPLLKQTAKAQGPGVVRIVHVASSMHFIQQDKRGIFYEGLRSDGVGKNKRSGTILYGQSKLGNIHVSNRLAEVLRDDGILNLSLHPGNITTELLRHRSKLERLLIGPILYPTPMGAVTPLYAATARELTMEHTGGYLVPWARLYHTTHPKAHDKQAIDATWAFCDEAVRSATKAEATTAAKTAATTATTLVTPAGLETGTGTGAEASK